MKRLPFAISVVIILVISLYAWQGMTWYAHDILGAALPAGCSLFFYGSETQPIFTIAAGCPGKDLVRLWPLPIQSPWFEDCWKPVPATPIESPTEAVKILPQENETNTSLPEKTPTVTKELPAPSVTPAPPALEVVETVFSTPLIPEMTQEANVMDKSITPTPVDQPDNIFVVQAKEDLASRLNIAKERIELVEFKAMVWPDGSMGCPQPGMAYTQVQREGYLIRLRFESKLFDYHGGGNRPPFLCEETAGNNGLLPSPDLGSIGDDRP